VARTTNSWLGSRKIGAETVGVVSSSVGTRKRIGE
jgi:hypothetical protein